MNFLKSIFTVLSLSVATSVLATDLSVPESLRFGFQKYGTLVILKEQGTLDQRLKDLGIRVTWTEFPAGPQMLEALNVGSVDFGSVGETPPVFAQAAKADLVYVAHQPPAPTAEAIIVHRDSPIQSVADLKGKRVALNRGSNVHYLLVKALEEANLSIRDIQTAFLPPADARAAFQRGSVDAWVIWEPFLSAAEAALDARILRNGEGVVNNHEFYIAARPLAEKHPEILKIIIEEIQSVDQWAKSHLQEVADFLAPSVGLPSEVVFNAASRASYGARYLSPDVIAEQQKIADTFSYLKLIPRKLDIPSVAWQPE